MKLNLERLNRNKILKNNIPLSNNNSLSKSNILNNGNLQIDSVKTGFLIKLIPLSNDLSNLQLTIDSDAPLDSIPIVKYYYGESNGEINLQNQSNSKSFIGTFTVNTGDPKFDGSGYLNISILDSNDDVSNFYSNFNCFYYDTSRILQVETQNLRMLFDNRFITKEQALIVLSSGIIPYKVNELDMNLIGEMHSVSLSEENTFNSSTAINLYYYQTDVIGYDESSLGLYLWNESDKQWEEVNDFYLNSTENIISALVNQSGVYAIFAKSLTNDWNAPGKVEDLGALTVNGQGKVILTYTSTGDDNNIGKPLNYIVKYFENEISNNNWDSIYSSYSYSAKKSAGEIDTLELSLPESNKLYYFALKAIDEAGNIGPVSNLAATISGSVEYDTTLTSVPDLKNVYPEKFELYQNYPNPFNSQTVIKYNIPEASNVLIEVYNILGQRIKTLINDFKNPGYYNVIWNARNNNGLTVSSGVYLYRIKAGEFSITKKLILMK